MYLEIISPDKVLYSGNVKYVKVPGSKGSFGILKNHAAVISTLDKGVVKITNENDKEENLEVSGGVVEVLNNNIIILAK